MTEWKEKERREKNQLQHQVTLKKSLTLPTLCDQGSSIKRHELDAKMIGRNCYRDNRRNAYIRIRRRTLFNVAR